MASPEILEFDRLLAPIPGENPAGEALREDFSPTSVYHAIKDARMAARAAERSLVWDDADEGGMSSVRAVWAPVLELGPGVIAEHSKDLEVAAWMTEALIRGHGYAGLRDGFRLIRLLCEGFWDGLYPLPDEDGVRTRVAPITGLNGEDAEGVLIAPIANVPITAPGEHRPMALADYRRAIELEQIPDPEKREQRVSQGAVNRAMFQQAVAETPPSRLRDVLGDLGQCVEEFDRLCAVLQEKCGVDERGDSAAPPSSNIRRALGAAMDDLRGLVKSGPGEAEELAQVAEDDSGAMVPVAAGGPAVAGRVQTRDDAFRALLQVAEYFRRTEPHSPVSYALEQAVRWGRMSLPELLAELVPGRETRDQVFKLIGIPPKKESDDRSDD